MCHTHTAQALIHILRGLAGDKRAQRVYMQKVRTVEAARAKAKQVQLLGANAKGLSEAAAGAGDCALGAGRPTDAAARSVRRRKSEAQRQRSYQKLQHKHLKRRCEAAAAKAGGSTPRVLARVLACCGRFLEMLTSEGAERMARLRRAEAAEARADETLVGENLGGDADGLAVMRGALAAVAAAPQQQTSPRAVPPAPAWVPGGAGRPPVQHPLGRVAPGWTAWAKPSAIAVNNGKARAGELQQGGS